MTVRRVLVTGSNGLLGQKVAEVFSRGIGYDVLLASIEPTSLIETAPTRYVQLDITVRKAVKDLAATFEPEVIVNCAAMTNVDGCETEREKAWKINVGGVENLIDAARRNNARIIHLSSDYVFDGKSGPYREEDRPRPLSYYGKTKLAGENALRTSGLEYFIARTTVLYGFAPGAKLNFALWVLQNLEQKAHIRIVDDQVGNPTLADDLAYALLRAAELGKTGIYHLAGKDIVSRYEFARRLALVFNLDAGLIHPIKTAQMRQPAARPLQSGLVTLKAQTELGVTLSGVEEGLTVLKSQIVRAMKRVGETGRSVRQGKK